VARKGSRVLRDLRGQRVLKACKDQQALRDRQALLVLRVHRGNKVKLALKD
jgi:hypothetical protein